MGRSLVKAFAVGSLVLIAPMVVAQGGPVLRVQVAGGQTTFHTGERIPLELSFTAAEEKRYEVMLAANDRSGREHYEEIQVNPGGGWIDPLARYLALGWMGGGMSGIGELSGKPTVLNVDLNQCVRFDQPGMYTVTVASRRASDLTKRRFNDMAQVTVVSNPVTLKIVAATKEWQARRMAALIGELRAEPARSGIPSPAREGAIADMRYLGSKAAMEWMAANLREDRQDLMYQSSLGIIGLPETLRESALEEMNRLIEAADFPVSGWFLQTVAVMRSDGDTPQEAVYEERGRYADEAWRSTLAALPRKEGKARAETAQALMGSPPRDAGAEEKSLLGTVLAGSFMDLMENQQTLQLEGNWDWLRSDAMLPALKELAKLPVVDLLSRNTNLYSRRDLKAIALRRWSELDADGAMQEIMGQIGSGSPSMTAQSLYFLPDQTFPQFEGLWADRYMDTNDNQEETVLGGLMVRFGTGAAASQVAAKLNLKAGDWACEPQAAALGYLVKFDPETARPLLVRTLVGGKTGCNHQLFQGVSAYASGAVLADAAIGAIDATDDQTVMDALIYLAEHGRKDDEPAIWRRYVAWSQQWAGRGEVLDSQDRDQLEQKYQAIAVGENLGRALIANQGWMADDALIAKVLKGCVGEQVCGQLKQVAEQAKSLHVGLYRNGANEIYTVAQYQANSMELLGEKLEQYPKGTVFELLPSSQTSDQKALEEEARGVFKKKGMALESAH